MKKLLMILGLSFILALGVGSLASYAFAKTGEIAHSSAEQEWDTVETFDSKTSVEENFDFYFCSSQNARRSDELSYTWTLSDGAITRNGNIDIEDTTVNIAVMTYIGEVYDNFELSVDFKAGSLTAFWPVIGIRQQIPGKNYTVEGGGAGVFMQQNGKITLWGPIISGNVNGNLYEEFIPDYSDYYALVWHNMRILAADSNVKVYVDDLLVSDMTVNTTDYGKGYISLLSVNNDCSFDNFKVRALASSAEKGNEENNYEYAELGQSLDDIIAGGYKTVKIPDDDISTQLGAPTVSPEEQKVFVDEEKSDVKFSVGYNNGVFKSLELDGLSVDKNNYTRMAATLVLKADYVASLPVGENAFTLTTTGGQVDFTLIVDRASILFTDTVRVKKYSISDVSFKMDFGSASLDKVTLGGAILPSNAYTYGSGTLRISRNYLSTLPDGVYEVIVYDSFGHFVDCYVTIGIESSETYVINFDGLKEPDVGYGQDLKISRRIGLYGFGGGIKNTGEGTMFIFDGDNIDYNFTAGKNYSVTTYLKFNYTKGGTSKVYDLLMPIYFKTSDGNADIGYLRYNQDRGYYFQQEPNCKAASFTKVGDWHRLSFEFTYNSAWERMEIPVWMETDFTIDNFVLAPISNVTDAPVLTEELSIPKDISQDITIDCSAQVIGINFGDRALTASEYEYSDGQITFKKEFLSSLNKIENVITVYCKNSYHQILIILDLYSFDISGSTDYTLGGGDITLTVQSDPFTLDEATLFDDNGTLMQNIDYTVSGNRLTLKENYLKTLTISGVITIAFSSAAKLKFTVYTNKLLDVDFENGGMKVGFGYEMTQENTTGKIGKGVRLTNTSVATMLVLGGKFYDVEFKVGKEYSFSFDLKIENIDTDKNLVISGNSCYMPITFGSGKDVTYLRVTKTADGYTVENDSQSLLLSGSVSEKDADGFVTISFTFIPVADCTTLTFDVWMPSVIVVDNFRLIEL